MAAVIVHGQSKPARSANLRTRHKVRELARSLGLHVSLEGECAEGKDPGWHGWIWTHGTTQSGPAWADEYDAIMAGLQHLLGEIAAVLPLDVELPLSAEGKAA